MNVELKIIGQVCSEYKQQSGTPIQPHTSHDKAQLEITSAYREGLTDLEGFDRVWVICWLDRSKPYNLKVTPYLDTSEHGLFTTRAPSRPNSIGLSLVEIEKVDVENGIISVKGIDILDGTPILDLKPYIPDFDSFPDSKSGWYDAVNRDNLKADNRFE